MSKPMDMAKIQDIARRLGVASTQPGYNLEVWESFKPEAIEACGDHPHFLEFMASYLPPVEPAKKKQAAERLPLKPRRMK